MYSDDEVDGIATNFFGILDSVAESRRGLNVDDAEPASSEEIPELPGMDKNVEEIRWTRADFNDVPNDDPDAFAQTTRPSSEGIAACLTPLSLLMFFVPHGLWEHIARCSEMKRVALVANIETTGRRDLKYMMTPVQAKRVFALLLVLVLNMLRPFAGGLANHG